MKELSVERIKAGDESELRQLFEMLLPRIRLWVSRQAYSYSYSSLGGAYGPEDAVQDAIYKIYSNLHKITPDNIPDSDALMRWCYVVTSNVVRDTLRKQHRGHVVNIETVDEGKLATTEIYLERVLEEAIQILPEDEKSIVLLWIEGKSPREIAQELGISLPTTYRRLKHAQKNLVGLVLPSAKDALKEVG